MTRVLLTGGTGTVGSVLAPLLGGQGHDVIVATRNAGRAIPTGVTVRGADRIGLPYYRYKVEAEELALSSGLPVTVQRSTQFHTLVAQLFAAQRRVPVLVVPDIPIQPIDVTDVAERLGQLVGWEPAGRAPDIGGPETAALAEFAGQWARARGRTARQWRLRLPGRTFAAYRAGHHLVPGPPVGRTTFASWLDA